MLTRYSNGMIPVAVAAIRECGYFLQHIRRCSFYSRVATSRERHLIKRIQYNYVVSWYYYCMILVLPIIESALLYIIIVDAENKEPCADEFESTKTGKFVNYLTIL